MARRLTWRALTAPARSVRRTALAAIVAAVTLFHVEAARELAADWLDFTTASAMPARMTVAYVRLLTPQAPAVIAPVAVAARSRRTAHPRASIALQRPATSASATAAADDDTATALPQTLAMADEPLPSASSAAASASAYASASASESALGTASWSSSHTVAAPTDVGAAVTPDIAVAAAASESAAASSPLAVAFVWPASTRVSYILTGNFRGDVSGQAQVEWIHAGDRYQVNLDLVVGPEFAPLITRRMTSDGTLSAAGLVPDRYDQDTKVVLRDRQRVSVRFEPDAIVLADGQRSARPAGVQDTASQFVQLTYLFTTQPALLRVGNTIDVPLALPRKTDHWIYDVHAEETLATPLGPLQTFHLKPRRPERVPGELLADIWFAPTLRYLPVRIRVEQDATTFIDLLIAKPPDMAAS